MAEAKSGGGGEERRWRRRVMAEAEQRGRKRRVWKKGVAWKEAKRLEEEKKRRTWVEYEEANGTRRRLRCGNSPSYPLVGRRFGFAL